MIKMRLKLFVLLLAIPCFLVAQSVKQMEYELELADNDRDRLVLGYKLANAYLEAQNWDEAINNGNTANKLAIQMGQSGAASQTAFIVAKASEGKARKDRKNAKKWSRQAQTWLNTSLSYAKKAKDVSLVLKVNGELAKQAEKAKDFRKAARYYADGYNFLAAQGGKVDQGSTQGNLKEIMRLQQKVDQLIGEKDSLLNVIWELENN